MNPRILRYLSLTAVCLIQTAPGFSLAMRAAEVTENLPVLHTATGTYSNVTVTLTTPTDIHIRHDGGVENIPLTNLNSAVLRQLGLIKEAEVAEEAEAEAAGTAAGSESFLGLGRPEQIRELDISGLIGGGALSVGLILGVLAVGLVAYVFTCYCYLRICRNAGHDPGILIWVPILQMIPLFRAAAMSPWWLLALLLPLVNLVAMILWCFKIVKACGKSFAWAIMLLLPLLNVVAFLYLAFSGPGRPAPEPRRATAAELGA